jgi:hypothetical protein
LRVGVRGIAALGDVTAQKIESVTQRASHLCGCAVKVSLKSSADSTVVRGRGRAQVRAQGGDRALQPGQTLLNGGRNGPVVRELAIGRASRLA